MGRAGKYRHRVTIQQPTAGTADDYGEQTDAWSRVKKVWAEVRDLAGGEAFRADQVQPEVTTAVRMRHWSGMAAKYRFLFGTRTLYPVNVIQDPRGKETICLCKETP